MKDKEYFLELLNKEKLPDAAKKLISDQIELFFSCINFETKHNYTIGDDVLLPQGTLLHGTYKNIDGLQQIAQTGLITSNFIMGHESKYPFAVSVWNLQNESLLKDYINFYSGGTIRLINHITRETETEVIPYTEMPNLTDRIKNKGLLMWQMEQTKEARFLPSLIQDFVQIGIIINGQHPSLQKILQNGDVLQEGSVSDNIIQVFIRESHQDSFLINRKNKDCFFTNRESAVIFGIPSSFIEGVLIGRKYENDKSIIKEIKSFLPNCYVCNLDGKVIAI